ncbi:hypothetical protein [Leptospira idonii]|uniref:Uncharacterized protein n=1 Tax=Leptospira idonii TaxID=1193500 RepID=A0A4R9M6S2_9LEPT|nr:hypothetical protein [Leptospira idonii]TGN20849.1 hypothetical protein EHS15_01260 [Leptospira idonii]
MTKDKTRPSEPNILWKQIESRPEILKSQGYPENLKDFLDELSGKEKYEWGGDRQATYDHLILHFPGEISSVLYAIFTAYSEFKNEVAELEKKEELSSWEKLEKTNLLRNYFFPKPIQEILFPFHPSQKTVEFFYYSEDYVRKNPYTFARERKKHLGKKRTELYGKSAREISQWEDDAFREKILSLIYEREMESMNEIEKQQFTERIKRDEKEGDFWN